MCAMAVEAVFAGGVSSVLQGTLLVAGLAGLRPIGRVLVRMMAIATLGRAMLRHRDERSLGVAVTIDAGGGRARCERVASEAICLLSAASVGMRVLVFMTMTAYGGSGIGETAAFLAMAVGANDGSVPHVLHVTGTGSVLCPRGGHLLGDDGRRPPRKNAVKARHACRDEHEHRGQRCENGAAIRVHHGIPWQSRQGTSVSLSLVLEKPRP